MGKLSRELDSLALLFTHGVKSGVAYDTAIARMQAHAEVTKARVSITAAQQKGKVIATRRAVARVAGNGGKQKGEA